MFFKNYENSTDTINASIKGEVLNPDTYKLKYGSSVKDLVDMAGGFTENADQDFINTAETVADCEEIYIPKRIVEDKDKININVASAELLETLPSIGPKIADRIVKYREMYGAFHHTDEIMNVKGIGEKLYNEIKIYITSQ